VAAVPTETGGGGSGRRRRTARSACETEAIWKCESASVTYVIAQPCVDLLDKACIEECPVDCIYEGNRMLYIHPDECVDCGACEPVCPVEAIFYEDDVPEQWKDYYNANVEFFDDLGSPGGAAKVGKIDKDHPLVAALPPQADEH
jgi:NAD-dependent dihydropyrimidine dehydrogenase PreA subunit